MSNTSPARGAASQNAGKTDPAAASEANGAAATLPAPRKLTEEEIAKLGARLCTPKKPTRPLPELVKKVVLSAETEEKSIDRLYAQSIKTRSMKHESLLAKVMTKAVKPETKRMDAQEMAGMVDRLHERSVSEKTATINRLVKQFVGDEEHSKLTPEQQTDVNARLYKDSTAKVVDGKKALFLKYVVEREPKTKVQSRGELAETISRLSVKRPN